MEAGNVKSIREALEALVGVIDECNSGNPLWWHIGAKGMKPLKDARAALSAPPRNCDLLSDAQEALAVIHEDRGYVNNPIDERRLTVDWLFAEAKGATDGSK